MTHPLAPRALEAAAIALYAINPTRRTLKGDYFLWTDLRIDTQAKWYDYARAAVTAYLQSAPPEICIGQFVIRHAPKGIWIGRTDGEGGEFATQHVEDVIAQFYRANF